MDMRCILIDFDFILTIGCRTDPFWLSISDCSKIPSELLKNPVNKEKTNTEKIHWVFS